MNAKHNKYSLADRLRQYPAARTIARRLNVRMVQNMLAFVSGRSALHEVGWFKSARAQQSINERGEPIPWITYSAVYFLETRVKKSMRVYEYGSGGSTLWWAKKAKDVTSCEHDQEWHEYLKSRMPSNTILRYAPLAKDEYVNDIKQHNKKFHIIMIDGRERVKCSRVATDFLTNDGVIIWDNTERERYTPGVKRLQQLGFKRLNLYGLVPIDNRNNETSIFYREGNCLGI